MQRMADGEIQVLVCTTIIETGIDISNVNTIIIHDDLEICKNNIQDNYFSLEKQIKEFTSQEIKQLEKLLLNDINDKFKQKRLKDYLENIFIINLNNKILDIIRNRDIILINTFQETYLKYLELNKNTIGV